MDGANVLEGRESALAVAGIVRIAASMKLEVLGAVRSAQIVGSRTAFSAEVHPNPDHLGEAANRMAGKGHRAEKGIGRRR
jgi:hypothetical protein